MPRPPRIDFSGARHHVMNRGARHSPIFADDNCCTTFLEVVSELPERFGLRIHGYALMPNHFHLMLESTQGRLSDGMAFLQARYTTMINRRYRWDGPVFRGRFRNRVVHRDEHWMHLLAYVHLNPVRAKLVLKPSQATWTSHRAYAGEQRPASWLTTDEVTDMLQVYGGYGRYLRNVMVRRQETPDDFGLVTFQGAGPTSSDEFATTRPASSALPPQLAIEEVLAATGVSFEDLTRPKRGRNGNQARHVAAYWLIQRCGMRHAEVGRLLCMSEASVSKSLLRTRERMSIQASLRNLVRTLRELARKMEYGRV